MIRPALSLTCLVACAGSLGGCQHQPADAGFAEVRGIVSDRTGLVVQWDGHTADDSAVAATIASMLSHDLTADQAVQIALLNNRHLQATFENLGIAQADLTQAGLLKNPVFDIGVRFPDRSPAATYLDFAVAEDFLDIALLPARKKLAAAQFEQAKAEVSNEVLSLAAQVRTDVYSYQAARRQVELCRSLAQAAAASLEAAQKLHDAGNLNDLDFASARAEATRARIDLIDKQSGAAEAREKLTGEMGLWGSQTEWKADSPLPDLPPQEIDVEHLEPLALRQRLDLSAARQQVVVQSKTLGLTADYRFFQQLDAGAEFERETDGQWRIGPTISVPIPLFDQGQARVSRAESVLRQQEQRCLALAVEVRSQVRLARDKLLDVRAKVLLYRDELIPIELEYLHQMQLQYNGMFVGVFQLLEAKRDQINSVREYTEAMRDYWTARAELERAVGGRLPTAISTTQPVGDIPTK